MPSRLSSNSACTRRLPAAQHIRCRARLHPDTPDEATTGEKLIAALRCSPVDLALVTTLVDRDPFLQSLLRLLTGVPNCSNVTLSLQIVSIGVEPLIRILCALPCHRESSGHSLERDYQ
jgi:hypothetical protein